MYFFYVDESGNLDPTVSGERADGSTFTKDHIYVLAAVSLYERRWHGFEKTLNRKKWELIDIIRRSKPAPLQLELADCEVKSTWIRIPKERSARPFLANLTDQELKHLADLYYRQLAHHYMRVFGVVVDKRHLHGYMDSAKMHRKAWELLLELIEAFLREEHPKHQGALITDDISKERNRSLAMKHRLYPIGRDCRGDSAEPHCGNAAVCTQRIVQRRAACRPAGVQHLPVFPPRRAGLLLLRADPAPYLGFREDRRECDRRAAGLSTGKPAALALAHDRNKKGQQSNHWPFVDNAVRLGEPYRADKRHRTLLV